MGMGENKRKENSSDNERHFHYHHKIRSTGEPLYGVSCLSDPLPLE